MVEPLNMPQVGQDLTHGKIIAWCIAEGEPVKKGDIVAEVESEKASFEVESTSEGVLLKQLFAVDDEAEVFKPIAWIGHPGEAVPGTATTDASDEMVQTERASQPAASAVTTTTVAGRKSGICASPSARRIARERGLDLTAISGSGPGGRIIKRDVQALQATPAVAAGAMPPTGVAPPVQPAVEDEVIAFDRVRQIIADRLLLSRQTIPDFDISIDVDMTPALAWRQAYNQTATQKITVNDLIVRAVAQSLRRFPRLNSHVAQNQMVVKKDINLGIAVAVDGGLLVPVLAAADRLDLDSIASAVRGLAGDARRGVIKPGAPGTFSISNLGGSRVSRFTPIINPPECAILGVGAVEDRVVAHDGLFGSRKMMTLTLVCDHRAVDGAYAADFLHQVADHLTGGY